MSAGMNLTKKTHRDLDIEELEQTLTAVFNKGRVNFRTSKDLEWLEIDLIRMIPNNNGGNVEIFKSINVHLDFLSERRDNVLIEALHFQSDYRVIKGLL